MTATTIMTTISPVYANTITVNIPRSIHEAKEMEHLSSGGVTYEKNS